MHGIRDIEGSRLLTKLCIEFSKLNEDRFGHNFDSVSPFFFCGMEKDKEHFLLHCHRFDIM